jgi:hypothetical protein
MTLEEGGLLILGFIFGAAFGYCMTMAIVTSKELQKNKLLDEIERIVEQRIKEK